MQRRNGNGDINMSQMFRLGFTRECTGKISRQRKSGEHVSIKASNA
jgi:hypothetical protein